MLRKYVYKFVISSGNGEYARQLFIDTFQESMYLQVGDICTNLDCDTFTVNVISDPKVFYTHKIGFDDFMNTLSNKGIDGFYEIDKDKALFYRLLLKIYKID